MFLFMCENTDANMLKNESFFFSKRKCSQQITSVDLPQQTNNNCLGEGHFKKQ